MPSLATVRAAKRAALRAKYPPPPPKKFPKKRCLNCPRFFPLTKPGRKFCTPECKDEYNYYGSAFGPLKQRLEKLVAKLVTEKVGTVREEMHVLIDRLRKDGAKI